MEMGLGEWNPGENVEVEKERGRVRTREAHIGNCDLGLVTAVVAKHAVCDCLGDSSLGSLGLWEILNSQLQDGARVLQSQGVSV
jgi:hypothetical protein